jgi:predicted transposase/invertase (TIGR01784 family)
MPYDINPKVDLAFKKIFGVEENKDLTISLLNSIVSEEDQVADITFLNPYNPQNFAEDKLSILDIKAKGCNGKLFNIEIQFSDEADYSKRALYYWSRLYSEQLKTGEEYGALQKAIGIHILNFNCIDHESSTKYHHTFGPREKDLGFKFYDDMEIHTIELPKFEESLSDDLKDFVGKVKTSLDIWTTFLTKYNLLNPNKLPKELDQPELKKALGVLDHLNFAPKEREAYESRLAFLRMETSAIKKKYLDGLKEGEARGIEKGREEGKEEGLKEGEEKGKKAGLAEGKKAEKVHLAKNLLKMGQDPAFVAKATGLSKDEVEKLYCVV